MHWLLAAHMAALGCFQLVWEIQCEAHTWSRSSNFWARVVCSVFAMVVCHYVHYIGQYVFIWIFMEEPTVKINMMPPVRVTYSTEALLPKHELAVVASGEGIVVHAQNMDYVPKRWP